MYLIKVYKEDEEYVIEFKMGEKGPTTKLGNPSEKGILSILEDIYLPQLKEKNIKYKIECSVPEFRLRWISKGIVNYFD